MSAGGRVVIPAQIRDAMGVKPGDELVLRLEEKVLSVFSLDEAIRQAQAVVRRYVEPGRSLSDELIRERRREEEDD